MNDTGYILSEQQVLNLNREFYNHYPFEYFYNKWFEIISKLSNTDEYINTISGKEFSFRSIKMSNVPLDKDIVVQHAEIELYELYIHCLECFFRLFVSRAKKSECDWIEMDKLNTKKYHQALDKILKSEYSWLNSTMSESEMIFYSLLGCEYISTENNLLIVSTLKMWIEHCASELKSINHYNAFKHGMILNVDKGGFSLLFNQGTPIKFEKYDDVLISLIKTEKEGNKIYEKKCTFVNAEFLLSKTYIYANLIANMIYAGKHFFLKTEVPKPFVPDENFTINKIIELIKDNNGEDCSIISYTQPLSYYKYTDKK